MRGILFGGARLAVVAAALLAPDLARAQASASADAGLSVDGAASEAPGGPARASPAVDGGVFEEVAADPAFAGGAVDAGVLDEAAADGGFVERGAVEASVVDAGDARAPDPPGDSAAWPDEDADVRRARTTPGEVLAPGAGSWRLVDFAAARLSTWASEHDALPSGRDDAPSPPRFGEPGRPRFFDALHARARGYEAAMHLVALARSPSFFDGLSAEGALVVAWAPVRDGEPPLLVQQIVDDGSHLAVAWSFGDVLFGPLRVAATLFPLRSDRFRLGYLHDLSWGGDAAFFGRGFLTPGARLQLEWGPLYAFVGGKVAHAFEEIPPRQDRYWSVLAGGGGTLYDVVTLEAGAGWLERGTSPLARSAGALLPAFGTSTRAVLHWNTDAAITPDLRLHPSDPALLDLFRTGTLDFEPKLAVLAAVESSWRGSTLESRSPEALGDLVVEPALAAALTTRVQLWYVEVGLDAAWRDLATVVFDAPSLPPFSAPRPDEAKEPELSSTGTLAVRVPALRSTFVVAAGVLLPATWTTEGPVEELRISGKSRLVVQSTTVSILPCRAQVEAGAACAEPYERSPVFAARASAQLDFSSRFALLATGNAVVDPNRATIAESTAGAPARVFVTTGELGFPLQLGAGVLAQARF